MKREEARAGLIDFAQFVDPQAKRWYRAQHLRQIAGVLECAQRREITRVVLNIPPRHWKSSLVTKWEAKLLGDDPKEKIISASRALNLAVKFSKQVRTTLQSNRYRDLYPGTKIQRGSDSAEDWMLEGGYQSSFRAVGTGGGISGEGGTVLVLDDVSDPSKQPSKTECENDWEWYKNVIRTRADPGCIIVVVNNRVGVNDITGYLLDPERNDSADPPEDWTVVDVPAYDEQTGKFLWEERFGLEYYQKLQNDPHLWRVQYQQKPVVAEGDSIKREWFEYVPQIPVGARWKVRAWDIAFTEKQTQKSDPDYTATCKATLHNDILYLGEPRIFRKAIEGVATEIVTAKMIEPAVRYGMGRVAVKSALVKSINTAGFAIEEYEEHTDKIARASGWINKASQGRVKLVGTEKEWEAFCAQWWSFPSGAHDDSVDAVSGIVAMLKWVWMTTPRPEPQSELGWMEQQLREQYGR